MGALLGTTIDVRSPVFAVLEDDAAIAAQAVRLILSTLPGSLWSAPEQGCDLAAYVARGVQPTTLAILGRTVENAITSDPRFARCDVTATLTYTGSGSVAVRLAIDVYPRGGEDAPIPLVGVASAELVQITSRGL